ncbi:inositol-pentakisphosphate 2-kinase isoform X2 [Bactrocera dorsalis]|uniref:inositol-pentakisphosphate 2-kinase n=1 Tax=Bactrocera dorsalis TaxID=27457 RepID=A0ABM3JIG2_BACDO|nr:inositol-pentakisphosphate 2-kinase isoform X2 [Bactrocera dorsalis]
MAANTNIATTDINKQGEQPRDSTRMAFVAGSPAPSSTSATPQQKRHQEQCSTKILQALLGIAAQPQGDTQSYEPESVATLKQQWHMELSQIELIYRAEGNANLVLALPQFKKVLRLPKTSRLPTTSHSNSSKYNEMKIGNTQQQTDANVAKGRQVPDKEWQQHQQHQQQQAQQRQTQEMQLQHQPEQQKHQEVVQSASDPAVNQNAKDLTMEDFVAYIEVIRKLLGSEFVFETEIVRITAEKDIRWINERIRKDRPAYRRDKEFCGEFGLLLPDATRLPIAFDILLSNLQLHTGKINRRTSYCPLALFSGVPAQMVTAIDALLRCPQNNLRVFRNGILVYDGEKHCYEDLAENIFPGQIELLKDLVVACLLRDYTTNENSSDGGGGGEGSSSSSSIATNDEPADIVEVAKAASGQPHLSAASEQSAMAEEKQRADEMWSAMEESSVLPAHLTDGARGATEPAARVASRCAPTLPRPRTKTTTRTDTVALETTSQAQITEVETLCLPANCVLQKILHLQLLAKHHMPALHAAGYARKSEKSYNALKALLQRSCQQQIGDALQPVEAYMLGATALDCSIMLAFQEISTHNTEHAHPRSPEMTTAAALPRHCVVLPRYKRSFLTKVTLVDLDPKPDSHLCKYIKQTSQALNLFMDSSS